MNISASAFRKILSTCKVTIVSVLVFFGATLPSQSAIIFSDHYSYADNQNTIQSKAIDLAREKGAIQIDLAAWDEFKNAKDNCRPYVSLLDQFLACSENPFYSEQKLDS